MVVKMDNNRIPGETKTTVPPENASDKAGRRKAGWFIRDVFEWGETLVSAVIIIVVVFAFVARVTSVDGSSMYPTLKDQDRLLVTSYFYKPERNDIVVIFAPRLKCCSLSIGGYCSDNCRKRDGMGKDIIKRVIGVEGDKIRIDGNNADGEYTGRVYRNGEILDVKVDGEQFFEDGHLVNGNVSGFPNGPTFTHNNQTLEVIVPPGYVFVLGDNRGNSVDSRFSEENSHDGLIVGLVDVNNVAGKAFFRMGGDRVSWGGFWKPFGFIH